MSINLPKLLQLDQEPLAQAIPLSLLRQLVLPNAHPPPNHLANNHLARVNNVRTSNKLHEDHHLPRQSPSHLRRNSPQHPNRKPTL
jgi:hypothetical protein